MRLPDGTMKQVAVPMHQATEYAHLYRLHLSLAGENYAQSGYFLHPT